MRKKPAPTGASCEAAEDSSAQLNISSLIDVAFLLLVFFLVTSTLQPREADLNMSLAGEGPPRGEPVAVKIVISADDTILWGNEAIVDGQTPSTESLRAALRNHRLMTDSFNQPSAFILHANDSASYQRMIDVIDAFAHEGVKDLLLADQP